MDEKIKRYSREMRKNLTDAELKLWYELKDRRFSGLKFRRQYPIDKYISDFCCKEKMLIVEIDGGQHNKDKDSKYDEERTKYLEQKGYKVIRFWNTDVLKNIEEVLKVIESAIS